jgi:hypothetical protein
MLDERSLEWMKSVRVRQSFDRDHFATLILHGERQTGQNALAIDKDRARATCALVATLLGAVKLKRFPQKIEQRHARVGREWDLRAVDLHPSDGQVTLRPLAENELHRLRLQAFCDKLSGPAQEPERTAAANCWERL